jgi:hypothetical protein
MAEQQRQEQPVEHEAAVATAVLDSYSGDADQTANGLRPVPNELTTASQPFKRNGLSP